MKIKKITKKTHEIPKKIYCFYEPINHECLVIGKSGKSYASYQCFLFSGSYSLMYENIDAWGMEEVESYISKHELKLLELFHKNDKDKKILTVCKDIQDRFFLLYPKLKEWFNTNHSFAKTNGYVDSPLGGR